MARRGVRAGPRRSTITTRPRAGAGWRSRARTHTCCDKGKMACFLSALGDKEKPMPAVETLRETAAAAAAKTLGPRPL